MPQFVPYFCVEEEKDKLKEKIFKKKKILRPFFCSCAILQMERRRKGRRKRRKGRKEEGEEERNSTSHAETDC
jgi:hypothetical protein